MGTSIIKTDFNPIWSGDILNKTTRKKERQHWNMNTKKKKLKCCFCKDKHLLMDCLKIWKEVGNRTNRFCNKGKFTCKLHFRDTGHEGLYL